MAVRRVPGRASGLGRSSQIELRFVPVMPDREIERDTLTCLGIL